MSQTIKAAIQALKSRIADAYMAVSQKGGTLPATQDSANLPTAIASIPSGGGQVARLVSVTDIVATSTIFLAVDVASEYIPAYTNPNDNHIYVLDVLYNTSTNYECNKMWFCNLYRNVRGMTVTVYNNFLRLNRSAFMPIGINVTGTIGAGSVMKLYKYEFDIDALNTLFELSE